MQDLFGRVLRAMTVQELRSMACEYTELKIAQNTDKKSLVKYLGEECEYKNLCDFLFERMHEA